MLDRQLSCKQRWAKEKNQTIGTLRKLWNAHCKGENSNYYKKIEEEYGNLYEYGLCFDYVAPGTFTDQLEGYWRYQISYGGPSDEFRFYASGPDQPCYRIEYTFLDWFDGESRALRGKDLTLLELIWNWFQDMGSVENEYNKVLEEV